MKKLITILIIFLIAFLANGCELEETADEKFEYTPSSFKEYKANTDFSFKQGDNKYYYAKCLNYGYVLSDSECSNSNVILTGISDYDHYLYQSQNDPDSLMYYHYQKFYTDYSVFYQLWIQDNLLVPDEDDDIQVTKITITQVPNTIISKEYNSVEFSELFEEVTDITFLWNEETNQGIKVDAYCGYIKIEFYNENYKQSFTIMTKIYQDSDNNYYIRKGIERFVGSYEKWYKLNSIQ